jgi:hypothetical protein
MRAAAVAVAALVLASLAAPPAPAIVIDAATVRAVPGQAYDGFIINPNETHAILLEDFAPQTFGFVLKAARGSTLLPDITLRDPSNLDVTATLAAFRKDGARSVVVKNAAFPSGAGRYVLRVTGKTGSTGEYLLKVTAKVVRVFKGTGIVPGSGDTAILDPAFFVPTEALASLKVIHGSGSTLVPKYTGAAGPACSETRVVPGLKAGTATFVSPDSGDFTVSITGDGGTAGTFSWVAKVKPVKPSKKPVRVNGGASFLAAPGPAPAARITSASQDVVGFATDGVDVCWREVRTTPNPPSKVGRNTLQLLTVTGKLPRKATDFATDSTLDPHNVALGRDRAAVVAAGFLFGITRDGKTVTSIDSGLSTVRRVLADENSAYILQDAGILVYPIGGGASSDVSVVGGRTYGDMAFGGLGMAFADVTGGGDLEIRTVGRTGVGEVLLATLSPGPVLQGFAARGHDVFFAVDDGSGGSRLYRASACNPGTAVPMAGLPDGPVTAMAADDLNVYVLHDDGTDGVRLAQSARGGGEATIILRGNSTAGFTIDPNDLYAVGGLVYLLADDGSASFYRVKRR